MLKEIIISDSSSETRIAICEDRELVELYVERPENERMVGDIYKGKVENVVDAIRAAFVDIGMNLNGFLPFADIGDQIVEFSGLAETVSLEEEPFKRRGRRKRPPKKKGAPVRAGQEILVQVTKEPIRTKGARLTTDISLPGRFLVLVPNNNTIGVSRKISNARERSRLRRLAVSLKPEGFGLIIRTVAVGHSANEIRTDLEYLLRTWKRIEEKAMIEKSGRLIYKDAGMTSSIIRDLFSPDIDRLLVDSRKLYGEIRKYLKDVAPNLMPKFDLYKDKTPIFDTYNIEEEIEKSLARKIWMKGGGHVIFDQVEAMVVVDVNSGRSVSQKDHELHALETDIQAAQVIARQLRLRDIGGIVVIDFIDLSQDSHRKKVVAKLRRELQKDRAAFDILPMNDFGLVSLTRERIRPSLLYQYSEVCPRCNGLGRIPAKSTIITQIERAIQKYKTETGKRRLILRVTPALAAYLKEGIRSRARRLMWKYFVTLKIVKDPDIRDEDFLIESSDMKKE
ncbi:Rne/Rng family ribonuclease [bacterium]|nr:Rne/Rng family ribonuclease [bacterium]